MAVSSEQFSEAAVLIELPGVYDGWSIAQLPDGRMLNRWSDEAGTGPAAGMQRRWEATEVYISEHDGVPNEYFRAAAGA
jgi:hypothetical protein